MVLPAGILLAMPPVVPLDGMLPDHDALLHMCLVARLFHIDLADIRPRRGQRIHRRGLALQGGGGQHREGDPGKNSAFHRATPWLSMPHGIAAGR